MFKLAMREDARGTRIESLCELVDAAGLVITVHGSGDLNETRRAIFEAAPRLSEEHEVRANGMILSRVGSYRIFWGIVSHPGGSLAILTPLSIYEGQDRSEWISHFMREVLDPVNSLSSRGYRIGGGGDGSVTDFEFAQAFAHAYV
ncbi:hypothetical protein GCM10010269_78310 [Streptomyces humidus]|uniref:Uncharacterized protein n=1 Tax=Streptomyces humidus TaxID=52259 RepID=A0A918GB22_9ACTN|nr:hypothetical protein [Streptomyces humidus]GGS28036.1 hypothetical protein GCM10010269_78310 [Streptomyces humidus]